MRHFLGNLLTGLTTVFAWTPATILLIMPLVGIYTGLLYFTEMDIVRLIGLCLFATMAIAGYLGLTSICWGLQLPIKTKVLCLTSGTIALASAIVIGYLSDNTLLHISFSIEHIYLFISPLLFLLLHTAIELKKFIALQRQMPLS